MWPLFADASVTGSSKGKDTHCLAVSVTFNCPGIDHTDIARVGNPQYTKAPAEIGIEANFTACVVDADVACRRGREDTVGVLAIGINRAAVVQRCSLLALHVHATRRCTEQRFAKRH